MKCRLGSLMEHMDVRLMFYPRQAYLKVWLLHFITSVTKFLAVASLRLKHPSCPFFSQFCYKKGKYLPNYYFIFCLGMNVKNLLKWRHNCWTPILQSKQKRSYSTRRSVVKCWSSCEAKSYTQKPQNWLKTKNLWKNNSFFLVCFLINVHNYSLAYCCSSDFFKGSWLRNPADGEEMPTCSVESVRNIIWCFCKDFFWSRQKSSANS